jgi:uncharacterized metal-binding protein YceD (DUF177 family)
MPAVPSTEILRLSDIARDGTDFVLAPDAKGLAALADILGIVAIRKLRFAGRLAPLGRTDWELTADLGATVVQECVVTLAPVTTRIDERVIRRYLADMPEPEGTEIEMPADDCDEPLPVTLDLAAVMAEALTLALPPFPRAAGAELGEATFAEKGAKPLSDEDVRPFAGLADLRRSLEGKDDDND